MLVGEFLLDQRQRIPIEQIPVNCLASINHRAAGPGAGGYGNDERVAIHWVRGKCHAARAPATMGISSTAIAG